MSVSCLTEEKVQLNGTEFSSTYLAKRLDGVEKAYAFAVTIGDELWKQRASASDPLEQYLFETSYSLSGIIYAKGEVSSDCTLCPGECSRRKVEFDSMALVMKWHGSTEEV